MGPSETWITPDKLFEAILSFFMVVFNESTSTAAV